MAVAATALSPAMAETLSQALSAAYKFNPKLDAARASQRATDEEVPRALSGYRPSVTGTATTTYQNTRIVAPGAPASTFATAGELNPKTYGIGVVQPLFRGFRTVNAVNGAEATVRAGRETLRLSEQGVLLEAVTAFGDVVRDLAIVRLRENNVTVLTRDLKSTQDRFNVGEVTRTDVAQAEARLAAAQADASTAIGNLKAQGSTAGALGALPSATGEACAHAIACIRATLITKNRTRVTLRGGPRVRTFTAALARPRLRLLHVCF